MLQDCGNPIANTLKLTLSFIKPPIYTEYLHNAKETSCITRLCIWTGPVDQVYYAGPPCGAGGAKGEIGENQREISHRWADSARCTVSVKYVLEIFFVAALFG